jgi:enoyl-CoA hydratase
MDEELLVEDRGRVRFMRINRPEKRNAMPFDMLDRMLALVREAETDPRLSVVVLGSVGPHFSSGYDASRVKDKRVGEKKISIIQDVQFVRGNTHRWRGMWECAIPVLAAVRGLCLAGGTDLALHADLIVAGRSAKFGFPAVRYMGVPPTNMWIEKIGLSWTKRLLLTGDLLGAETAARLGLAIDVVDDDQVDAAALALAERMALIDKELLMANKLAINLSADATGRGVVQEVTALMDAVGHFSKGVTEFWDEVSATSMSEAFAAKNRPFGKSDPL